MPSCISPERNKAIITMNYSKYCDPLHRENPTYCMHVNKLVLNCIKSWEELCERNTK